LSRRGLSRRGLSRGDARHQQSQHRYQDGRGATVERVLHAESASMVAAR
jgi:hypothetical protein